MANVRHLAAIGEAIPFGGALASRAGYSLGRSTQTIHGLLPSGIRLERINW
jgi:hypothetical protein